jgi:hypothetical protein
MAILKVSKNGTGINIVTDDGHVYTCAKIRLENYLKNPGPFMMLTRFGVNTDPTRFPINTPFFPEWVPITERDKIVKNTDAFSKEGMKDNEEGKKYGTDIHL